MNAAAEAQHNITYDTASSSTLELMGVSIIASSIVLTICGVCICWLQLRVGI